MKMDRAGALFDAAEIDVEIPSDKIASQPPPPRPGPDVGGLSGKLIAGRIEQLCPARLRLTGQPRPRHPIWKDREPFKVVAAPAPSAIAFLNAQSPADAIARDLIALARSRADLAPQGSRRTSSSATHRRTHHASSPPSIVKLIVTGPAFIDLCVVRLAAAVGSPTKGAVLRCAAAAGAAAASGARRQSALGCSAGSTRLRWVANACQHPVRRLHLPRRGNRVERIHVREPEPVRGQVRQLPDPARWRPATK